MIDHEIERKIEDFRALGISEYIPRQGRVELVDHMVSTVIGARRAGKSFRVMQVADEMLRQGVLGSINNICLMDFDNPILANMKASELRLIQDTFLKLTPEADLNSPLLFIMDEIHKISGWEQYVIDLSKNPNWKVIVTGSSSKLLRRDIATELRGKAVSSNVFPLSFREFLDFKYFNLSLKSTKGQAEARRLFDEYFRWGGFPAIANVEDHTKEILLREYFDTMILKDLIQRYNISKPQQCIHLYHYLLSNISKPFTLQSAFDFLKQSGFTTSRDSVREYIDWAQESWLLFIVPIYSNSLKGQERNYKKVFAIDWGLANNNSIVWNGSHSRALENMVFIYLYQMCHRVHYYLTRTYRQEVDFICVDRHGRPTMAVQVCTDISNEQTLKRELNAIVNTAKYFDIKENLIVTYNQERDIQMDSVTVKAVPAWRWMLNV